METKSKNRLHNPKHGVLLILAGPTAAGKSNIQKGLLDRNPGMHKVVTCTTRLPRGNEKEGVDYHFIDEKSFKKKLSAGDFIEFDCYNGQYYGTPKSELSPLLQGCDVTWILTMPRVLDIDSYLKNYDLDKAELIIDQKVTLLIMTPSWNQLERQFILRRGGSHEEFLARIQSDREFLESHDDLFDHTIYNHSDKLTEAIDNAQKILDSRRNVSGLMK